jgi:hypothetical protein
VDLIEARKIGEKDVVSAGAYVPEDKVNLKISKEKEEFEDKVAPKVAPKKIVCVAISRVGREIALLAKDKIAENYKSKRIRKNVQVPVVELDC